MPMRLPRWFLLALTAVGSASIGIHAQKASAPDVLQAAADYLVQYSQKLSVVTAEEEYTQYETSSGQMGTPVRLSADVVLVGLGNGGTATFRDVFAIDSKPVRPRDGRLPALFRTPSPPSMQQARDWSEESVRRYVNPNLHILDEPTAALEFLRKENQERSTFKIESVKTMSGAQVAILRFTEQRTPRLMPMPGDAAATGRFWVDVASGTVRQTELGFSSKTFNIRSTVKYAAEPTLGLWLPTEMSQVFDASGQGAGGSNNMGSGGGYNAHQAFEARASYDHFRR